MNAHEINQLVEKTGITGLSNTFGISRRQAESMATATQRAEHEGKGHRELPAGMISQGIRRYDQRPPMPGHALTDAEVAEHAARIIPPALVGLTPDEYHEYQRAEKERLRLQHNRENGHPEWGPIPHDFEPIDHAKLNRARSA